MARRVAGEIMYRLANERGLLESIIRLCEDARKEGGKIGTTSWSINGMLEDLGGEIEDKKGIKYPGNRS